MPDRTGQRLDNYQLKHLLGKGSFGEVYLAEHVYHKTEVALKVLPPLSDGDLPTFLNEARTMRLKHPHIVQVRDFGVEQHVPFIVMDYAPHGTLRQRHPKGTRLPLEIIVRYVSQVAGALQYAHNERVIHRDVKPENLLFGPHDEVLVSDFGIATMAKSSRSQSLLEMAGTIAYMAPEQVQGKPRFASDQYALAIIVYEWLCGERPFQGTPIEIATQQMVQSPLPLHNKLPGIKREVEQVIMKALAKDPQERFDSIQAFATALEQVYKSQIYQPQRVNQNAVPPAVPVKAIPPPMQVPQQKIIASTAPETLRSARLPAEPRANPTKNFVPASPPLSASLSNTASIPLPGTLPANDGSNLSRSAFAPAQTKRPRFLWLFVAALTVLLLGLLGSGLYYFVHPMLFPTVDVDQTLSNANVQIDQAQKDVTAKDGLGALTALSTAQKALRSIQGGSLSSSQTKTLHLLQSTLVTTTQAAITAYNQQELISACNTNLSSSPVSAGTTNTQPTSLAVVQSGATVYRYALGADHNLYELDAHSNLANKQAVSGVFMLAGAQDHVLALTEAAQGRTISYSVSLLTPNATGGLDSKDTFYLDTATNNGTLQPLLLTAWGADAYVVLASQAAPYSVTIMDFPEANNKFGMAYSMTVSVSNKLMSIAAFPDHQLFLLDASGNVQSLQFATTTQQPSSVVLPYPLADPISIGAGSFSFNMDVPVPNQEASSSLTFSPSAAQTIFLTTELVNNAPRLYIVDSANHRVIVLQPASNPTAATASATPTTQVAQQGATATPNSVVESNGQPGASVSMSLVQQYVSSDLLTAVKGVATNPKIPMLYLLTTTGQNAAGTNLVSVDVSQQNVCTP